MTFTLQATTTTPTTIPGGVEITINGSSPTTHLPGAQQDSSDLYGIIFVLLAIGVAIVVARWVFGRKGSAPR